MDYCGYPPFPEEALTVNKRLGRLLRPGMGLYFMVMAAFCAVALVL